VTVGAGQFLYTAPDDMLSQIEVPGMELRQANDWGDMEAIIQTFNLQRWFERGSQHADESNVPFPDISQRAGTPDLVIELVSRDYKEGEASLATSNPDLIGVPVSATILNQGDGPANIFKVSVEGTAQDGTYVRAFTVPGQRDVFYPHTVEPVQPGELAIFEGLVYFPSSLAGTQVSMEAVADSCSGEESAPDECFVAETDEGNNRSEPVFYDIGYPGR
jgi:hypothetical protein